jgi:hypothetical protein
VALLSAVLSLGVPSVTSAAPILTVAGTGSFGYSGDGVPATTATLNFPTAAVPTSDGGFLIADSVNNRVRKVSPAGIIATVAGDGIQGRNGEGIPATSADIYPSDVAPTGDGGFLIAEQEANRVRKVSAAGLIYTVAGSGHGSGIGTAGDGIAAATAQLQAPSSVAPTSDGGFLIADYLNYRVRKVSAAGIISSVAGTGGGTYNGDGSAASVAVAPFAVATTGDGGFLIAEPDYGLVRRVSSAGIVSTVAGTLTQGYNGDGIPAKAAQLNSPRSVAPTSDGGVLIGDTGNNLVRKVSSTGIISTVVGTGAKGYNGNGIEATAAQLSIPRGVAPTSDGGFLIADYGNALVRKVQPSAVPPVPPEFTIASTTVQRSKRKKRTGKTTGVILLDLIAPAPGSFAASATFQVKSRRRGQLRSTEAVAKQRTLQYGTGSATVTQPGHVPLTVNPSGSARRALRTHRSLLVSVQTTYRRADGASISKDSVVKVRTPPT